MKQNKKTKKSVRQNNSILDKHTINSTLIFVLLVISLTVLASALLIKPTLHGKAVYETEASSSVEFEAWIDIYDVTGLDAYGRKYNGTFYTNTSCGSTNLMLGNSYRFEFHFLEIIDTSGGIKKIEVTEIPNSWLIDQTGIDQINTSIVFDPDLSVDIKPFTTSVVSGTTQTAIWNQVLGNIYEGIKQWDIVKFEFVIDVNATTEVNTTICLFGKTTGSKKVNQCFNFTAQKPPKINLVSPYNGATVNNETVDFVCNSSSTRTMNNVSLYTNRTGVWQIEETKTSGITNTLVYFSIPGLNSGAYEWNCEGYDVAGLSDLGDSNWNFYVSYCYDPDGDGYGECPNCGTENGCSYNETDCNSTDNTTYPGAIEYCDGKDNDCDGIIDDNWTATITCPGEDTCAGTPQCISGIESCYYPNGNYCDDDEFCTISTTCNGAGACTGGSPRDCSDGINCTDDSCDEANNECDHVPDDDNCPDDGVCNGTSGTIFTGTCSLTGGCTTVLAPNENTNSACSDLIDNDCDGNIDCDDVDCYATAVCDFEPLNVYILSPYPLTTAWYRNDFYVRANVSDGYAGPDTVRYRYELGGSYVDMVYNTPYYESLVDITTIPDGIYTFRVWANDTNGNINDTETIVNVGIDDTPPVTNDDAPPGWQNADFTVNLNCTDATSGCLETWYNIDGVNTTAGTSFVFSLEGNHSLKYYSYDNAGNDDSPSGPIKYLLLDKTEPVTTINYTSTDWQDSDIKFTLSCDDGSLSGCYQTWYCIDTTNTCNPYSDSVYSGAVTHPTEGISYVRFGSTDNAGNYETAKSQILKIDKTNPSTAPVLLDPGAFSTDGNVQLNWTAAYDAVSGIDYYQVWRSVDNITFTKQDGDLSNTTLSYYDTGLMNNKTYYYYIKAVDRAGNYLDSNTEDIIIDTDNPSVEIIQPEDDELLNTSSVEVLVNFSNTNKVNCQANYNSLWYDMNNDNVISGTADYTFSLSDGTYNISVRCYDESLLYGYDYVYNIVVDTTDPTGSVVIDSGAEWTDSTSVSLGLTYSDGLSGVDKCRYSNDGSSYSAWEVCTATKAWTLAGLDGEKTVYYQIRDNAGNIKTFTDTIKLDTTNPVGTITAPLNGTSTNDTTPEINFTFSDNLADDIDYVLKIDGDVYTTGTGTNPDSISYTVSPQLKEGTRTIELEVEDEAGNTYVDEITIIITPQAPVTVIQNPANGTTTNDQTPEIEFEITDNTDNLLDYVIYIDDVPMTGGTGQAHHGESQKVNLTTLIEGYHYINVEATDDSGLSANSTVLTLIIDLTNPTSVINGPTTGTLTNDSTPEINVTLSDNFDENPEYVIYINGTADGTGTVVNGTLTNLTLPELNDSSYEIIVEAIDNAGNSQNSTPIILIVDTIPPEVEIIAPDDGATIYQNYPVLITANASDLNGIDNVVANISWDSTSILVNMVYNNATGLYEYTFTNTSLLDEYTVVVTAVDNGGNSNSDTVTFIVGLYCGDNEINNEEDCDGEDLGGASCKTFGFKKGTLSCKETCVFDKSDCSKGGGNGCFLAGTKILMEDGYYKNIEDVEQGDYVVSDKGPSRVIKTFVHYDMDSYLIINNELKVTANHPIFINGVWKQAGEIIIGDKLLDKRNNLVIVYNVEEVSEDIIVYNLEVENYHTYYAEDYLVHNKGPGCLVNWNCTSWEPEECEYGDIQTRVCIDLNNCGTNWEKPAEERDCPEEPPEEPEEEKDGGKPRIIKPKTGFVAPEEEAVKKRSLIGQAYLFVTSGMPWPLRYIIDNWHDLLVWIIFAILAFLLIYCCMRRHKGEKILAEGAGIVWFKKWILGKKYR